MDRCHGIQLCLMPIMSLPVYSRWLRAKGTRPRSYPPRWDKWEWKGEVNKSAKISAHILFCQKKRNEKIKSKKSSWLKLLYHFTSQNHSTTAWWKCYKKLLRFCYQTHNLSLPVSEFKTLLHQHSSGKFQYFSSLVSRTESHSLEKE